MTSVLKRRLLVTLFAVLACSGISSAHAQDVSASAPGASGQAVAAKQAKVKPNDAYRLGTGDKVRVIVFGEDELSGNFTVDDSGLVRMPLIGQTQAKGRNIRQFESEIATKLADGYLKNPRVSVEITTYRPFYIIGEVKNPGEYPYVSNMNAINAVALAGGYTYRANEGEVYLRRKGASNEALVPADEATQIQPGDIIRVPERFF